MKPDQLIQCMRTINLNTVRVRLEMIKDSDPSGYQAISNLFAPIVENKKRWSAKVAPVMREIQKGIANG